MSAKTTPEYLISNANNHAKEKAISTKNKNGEWVDVNWVEFHDQTASVAKSLIALGFEEGDKLSIYSYNRICLLYTSPSPRDLSTSRMPSSA